MMGLVRMVLAAVLAVTLGVGQEAPADRLYGRVVTAGGEVFEGYLRWDRNEGSWADLLDGTKELPWQNLRDAERLGREPVHRVRERSISILGLRISWTEGDGGYPTSATSGIRFGHLRALEVYGGDRARLTLKSGEEIELEGGATDLGDALRDLVVDDPQRGRVELRWRDLDVVEFMEAPRGLEPPAAERLYGTLYTRGGLEFTGFVAWDADEILTTDVLDGEERGRDREIPFARIASIERAGSSGARVVLRSGETVRLRDSNDVDDGNRGITIADLGLGQVSVDWHELEELRFHRLPAGHGAYGDFDGGRALWGTVETESGERHTGYIRWDNDEESTWEMLDGRVGDVSLDVELGLIHRIRKLGSWGSEVTLLDGRVFDLDGSNDVDDANKGIYVTFEDGETVLVRWWDFLEVTFHP
jgi:hypothetical protein